MTEHIVAAGATGRTLQPIADELNADRVPTTRGGSKWFASSVAQTLKSAALDDAARQVAWLSVENH